jgi:hypothetical protein
MLSFVRFKTLANLSISNLIINQKIKVSLIPKSQVFSGFALFMTAIPAILKKLD